MRLGAHRPGTLDSVARQAEEGRANVAAVTAAVAALASVRTTEEAVRTALRVVHDCFGWVYGSHWRLDPASQRLVFSQQVGTCSREFQDVTHAASFGYGEGLSGRTWAERELVFVADLGEVTDCVRAPVAQHSGVRSGVCFPLVQDGQVVGTMDFFSTDALAPSEERLATLRAVAVLVSQACERVAETERQRHAAQDLATVNHLLRTVSSAGCRRR